MFEEKGLVNEVLERCIENMGKFIARGKKFVDAQLTNNNTLFSLNVNFLTCLQSACNRNEDMVAEFRWSYAFPYTIKIKIFVMNNNRRLLCV